MSRVYKKQSGFTMVELMLAMAFVAVLLILIAVSIIYISRIYNKGITIRELNQVGRTVSDDLLRSVSESMPFEDNYIKIDSDRGYFCTGRYTYVWNTGRILSVNHERYTYANVSENEKDNISNKIRLARFTDTDAQMCRYGISDNQSDNQSDEKVQLLKEQSIELLSSGDRDIAVQDFSIKKIASGSVNSQALYLIEFTLGTNDARTLNADRNSCLAPGDIDKNAADSTDANYCAVNSFSIVARAGSKI